MSEHEWKNDRGKRHRLDGPAYVSYRRDGTVSKESWWLDGVTHRESGPAVTTFYGNATHEVYFHFGVCHRIDGPAEVWRSIPDDDEPDDDDDFDEENFFLYGKQVEPAVFAKFSEAISSGAPEEWARAFVFGDES